MWRSSPMVTCCAYWRRGGWAARRSTAGSSRCPPPGFRCWDTSTRHRCSSAGTSPRRSRVPRTTAAIPRDTDCMRQVYLLGGVRTPIGKYGGALASVRPDDMAALVLGEAVRRAAVPPDAVDEVILGAANQAGEDNRNVARMAVLLAGLPDTVPGFTVNRLCASGLTAVASAVAAVRAGDAEVVVAGGVESMTRAPWVTAKPATAWASPAEVADTALGWRFVNPRMADVDDGQATIGLGETAEKVARLDGIVTAGSASPLSDGAAAIVVVSEEAVRRHRLEPRARALGSAAAGVAPSVMGLGPVPATEKLLSRLGWTVADIDAVELNEAFAPQAIACIRRLGLDPETVNADGGAIALGHPLGCSGGRLVVTLLGRLGRTGGRRGVATLCIGVGQGQSLAVELV